MNGYETMPTVVQRATADISAHLWSLYWLARTLPIRTAVELGVRSGDSTRALLAAAEDIGIAVVYSFDMAGDAYRVREVTEGYGLPWFDRWICEKSDSVSAAKKFIGGDWIDMVFVDTDHSFQTTIAEIAAWHKLVRVGGIMAFHDVGLDEPGRDGVSPAIRQFLQVQGDRWTYEEHRHVAEGDCGLGWMTRVK